MEKQDSFSGIKWWGYVHVSGSKHVRRYFGIEDIQEAMESPFVKYVYGPWENPANPSREAALATLEEKVHDQISCE